MEDFEAGFENGQFCASKLQSAASCGSLFVPCRAIDWAGVTKRML